MSPSMLKTVSVTITFRDRFIRRRVEHRTRALPRPRADRSARRHATSRTPSISDAWFSASENSERAAAGERRERREVRHVAGAEIQGARVVDEAAGKRGEIVFELRVRARMAAEQMRTAAARAVEARAFGERRAQRLVRREPEVIVAREADDLVAVHRHVRGAGAVRDAAPAAQAVPVDIGETLLERIEERVGGAAHAASASVASKVTRVRSASSMSSSSSRM